MKRDTLFDDCDVCVARTETIGWLDVLANEKGREAVQTTFAEIPIEWTYMPEVVPRGWSVACINLPKLIESCPTHTLVKLDIGPDGGINAEFDYVKRLAVSLHVAGCRVITSEGDKPTDYKKIQSE